MDSDTVMYRNELHSVVHSTVLVKG